MKDLKFKKLNQAIKELIQYYDISEIKEYIDSEFCDCCENKGYLEVTREDNCEYIESCDNCNYVGNDLDDKARDKALEDGYKLDANGKILD